MENKKLFCNVFLLELLQTDALITPIKTIFFITYLSTLSDISLYKLIMIAFVFLLEIPSGYISDKYGNKATIVCSYLLTVISFIMIIVYSNHLVFIIANAMMGIANALLSGAKNSYLLILCDESNIRYKEIKISASAYKKIFELFLMSISGLCLKINIYLPFILTMGLYIILLSIVLLQKSDKQIINHFNENKSKDNILKVTKKITKDIFKNKNLMNELIFYTIISTLLISNFDFYNIHFKNLGIDEKYFGLIYSLFMIVNFVGIKLYHKGISKKKKILCFVLLPITFVTILIKNNLILGYSIIFQQLIFSYLMIHFEIYVLDSVQEIETSSHFQSIISFLYSSLRIFILLIITLILKIISIDQLYLIFSTCSLSVSIVYILVQKKMLLEKNDYQKENA